MEWFRFYTRTLDCRKVQSLPPSLFKAWVNLLCISSLGGGVLPSSEEISFRLRCSVGQADEWIAELVDRLLIDKTESNHRVMHDWNEHQYVSDDSTSRVRKHREKLKGNVSVTPPDTDTDTEQKQTTTTAPLPPHIPRKLPRPLSDQERTISEVSERMYSIHPKAKDLPLVPDALAKAVSVKPISEIEAIHAAWCKTEDWTKSNGRFAPSLASWLADRGFLHWPNGAEPAPPKKPIKVIPYDPLGIGANQ